MKPQFKLIMIPFLLFSFTLTSQEVESGAEEDKKLSGIVGINPTTMGTLGETAALYYRPLPFIHLGLGGSHDMIHQQDVEMEKLNGDILGDFSRDIWSGVGEIGGVLGGDKWEVVPYVSYTYNSSSNDILGRLQGTPTSGTDSFPQGTYSFVDLVEVEVSHGPMVNLLLNSKGSKFLWSLGGAWTPLYFYENSGTFMTPLPGTNFDNYQWRIVDYAVSTEGSKLLIQGRLGFSPEQWPISISGFGKLDYFRHQDGSVDTKNKLYWPNPVTPFALASNSTHVEGTFSGSITTIEGGLSIQMTKFQAKPIIELSYKRYIEDREYNYYMEVPPQKEKWIDDYDYFQIFLKWGF